MEQRTDEQPQGSKRGRRSATRRRRARSGPGNYLFLPALLLALLVHGGLSLLFLLSVWVMDRMPPRLPESTPATEVTVFTEPEIKELLERHERKLKQEAELQAKLDPVDPAKKKPPEPPPPKPDDRAGGRIVDLTPSSRPLPPPANAKYLAQFNSRTERETRKSGRPGTPRGGPPGQPDGPADQRWRPPPPPPAPDPPPQRTPQPPPPPSAWLPPLTGDPETATPGPVPRPRIQLPPPPTSLPPSTRPETEVPLRISNYEELLPPLDGRGSVFGGPLGNRGSDDYLPDLPEGDTLSVNAREFKYWSFFARVKQHLRQHWRPQEQYRRRDPYGKVYGVKDRVTVLAVTLEPSGKIHQLNLVQASGVDFLDDEALDAFRAAAAFPNPPPGLIEADGFIHFRFGFALVHNASRFDLFRYDF